MRKNYVEFTENFWKNYKANAGERDKDHLFMLFPKE